MTTNERSHFRLVQVAEAGNCDPGTKLRRGRRAATMSANQYRYFLHCAHKLRGEELPDLEENS